MALGTFTQIGQVDPTTQAMEQSGAPTNLALKVWEFTIGATADYSSGLAVTAAQLGGTAIVALLSVVVRQSGGTIRPLLGLWNSNTSRLQLYLQRDPAAAGGADIAFTEIVGATHLAANDVVRLTAIVI